MCLSLNYYPLVLDKTTGKQKILFNEGLHLSSKTDRDTLISISKGYSLNFFNKNRSNKDFEFVKFVSVPCGKCRECLNLISLEWAFKIHLESMLHEKNYFITLTYDDDNLPNPPYLVKTKISEFNKKLKTYLNRKNYNSNFRFYGVGEYGSHTFRPHYHIIYFGLDIPDLVYIGKSKKGYAMYESKFLTDVWGLGFVTIQEVSLGAACYVAKYCDKKKRLTKEEKEDLISKGIVPEYSVMSRRPGIGSSGYEKIKEDFKNGIYTHFVNGKSFSIPVAWRKKLKELFADSDILESYEESSRFKSDIKLSSLLDISTLNDLDIILNDKNKKNNCRNL